MTDVAMGGHSNTNVTMRLTPYRRWALSRYGQLGRLERNTPGRAVYRGRSGAVEANSRVAS
jgi:hypothetical protein